mgnify:CR=1 FL=1
MKTITATQYLAKTENETSRARAAVTCLDFTPVPEECDENQAIADFDALDLAHDETEDLILHCQETEDQAWLNAEVYPVACFVGDNRKPANL